MFSDAPNNSSPDEPPAPEPWRFQVPEESEVVVHSDPSWLWPSSLHMHLFCNSMTAMISLNMWFYILHLKLCGHQFVSWSTTCVKKMSPEFHWDEIKWPLLILPNCKWKDKLAVLAAMPGYLCQILLRDNWNHPKLQLPVKKEFKPKPKLSPSKRAMLTALAAFATIQNSQSLQLKSDVKLRQDLQRFKNPDGGLYTNRLSHSQAKSALHKAFITKMHGDTAEFMDAIGNQEGVVSSVVDSGASFTAIHNHTLVVPNTMQKLSEPIELDGIAGGCFVEYKCTIQFECVDKYGDPFTRQTVAYYHPELPCTLLSPQSFLQDLYHQKIYSDGTHSSVEDCFTLYRNRVEWHSDGKHLLDIPYDSSFLPRLQLFPSGKSESVLKAFHATVLSKSNKNLSPLKKIWLRLHNILGHPSFSLVQQLAVAGWFDTKALGLSQLPPSEAPMCEACKYGKQTRRPDGATTVAKVKEKEGALKHGLTEPGQRIFSDQLVSVHRGRLFHTAGTEREDSQFCGATVFVDAASGYIFAEPQVTLNASDTINAKHKFERHAMELGVTVESYHTDNGIYKSKAFTEELAQNYQSIRFSGVGAKWQNGVSEGAIRIIVSRARTMMLHANIHWPEVKDESLWPMALAHAVHVYNHTPNEKSGIAPAQIFSRTVNDGQVLRNLHTWGCPAYVLEPKLTEAGGKIPKWKPRSRRAQYLGVSPVHAETVALVRNLSTGYISPQFHVVFDDDFETVYADEDEPPPQWEDMCIFQRFQADF